MIFLGEKFCNFSVERLHVFFLVERLRDFFVERLCDFFCDEVA